jgi:hypothetical protein
MKNLIYLSALIGSVLSIASCTKSDLPPNNPPKPVNPNPAPVICDSAKLVNFVLSGSGGYEVAFSGKQNYTFFPGNETTVSIKPGIYSIFVYSPGNYSLHTFHFDGQDSPEESGARYDNVLISPCSGAHSLVISQ